MSERLSFGKALGDQRLVLAVDRVHQPMDRPDPIGPGLDHLEFLLIERSGSPDRAVEQHGGERQHMVAGLAVDAGALAARIGVDHPADGGPVGGRQLRREEQPMRLQRLVELVLHHPSLDPDAPAYGIDLEDPVHVAREVDDEAIAQRLAVGARAAAAWGQLERLEARLCGEPSRYARDHRCPWGRRSPGETPGRSSCRSRAPCDRHRSGSKSPSKPRARSSARNVT